MKNLGYIDKIIGIQDHDWSAMNVFQLTNHHFADIQFPDRSIVVEKRALMCPFKCLKWQILRLVIKSQNSSTST